MAALGAEKIRTRQVKPIVCQLLAPGFGETETGPGICCVYGAVLMR
jgi:hypothetical protein